MLDDIFLIRLLRSKLKKKKFFCQAIEGKILCTLAAYFAWVNSNSQLEISFMIDPKNRKRFDFPESLANQKKKKRFSKF